MRGSTAMWLCKVSLVFNGKNIDLEKASLVFSVSGERYLNEKFSESKKPSTDY